MQKNISCFIYIMLSFILTNCGGVSLLEIPVITPPHEDGGDSSSNPDEQEPIPSEEELKKIVNEVLINGENITPIYSNTINSLDIENNNIEFIDDKNSSYTNSIDDNITKFNFKISDFKDKGSFYENVNANGDTLILAGKHLGLSYADIGMIYNSNNYTLLNNMYDTTKVIIKDEINKDTNLTFTGKTFATITTGYDTDKDFLTGNIELNLNNGDENLVISFDNYYTFSWDNKYIRIKGENNIDHKYNDIGDGMTILDFNSIYLGDSNIPSEVIGDYQLTNANFIINGIFAGKNTSNI